MKRYTFFVFLLLFFKSCMAQQGFVSTVSEVDQSTMPVAAAEDNHVLMFQGQGHIPIIPLAVPAPPPPPAPPALREPVVPAPVIPAEEDFFNEDFNEDFDEEEELFGEGPAEEVIPVVHQAVPPLNLNGVQQLHDLHLGLRHAHEVRFDQRPVGAIHPDEIMRVLYTYIRHRWVHVFEGNGLDGQAPWFPHVQEADRLAPVVRPEAAVIPLVHEGDQLRARNVIVDEIDAVHRWAHVFERLHNLNSALAAHGQERFLNEVLQFIHFWEE